MTSHNWRCAGGPDSGCLQCHLHRFAVTTNQREGQTMAPLSVEDNTSGSKGQYQLRSNRVYILCFNNGIQVIGLIISFKLLNAAGVAFSAFYKWCRFPSS